MMFFLSTVFLFHRKKVLSRGEERKGEEENSSRSGYLPDVRMMWHGQYCEDREIRGRMDRHVWRT